MPPGARLLHSLFGLLRIAFLRINTTVSSRFRKSVLRRRPSSATINLKRCHLRCAVGRLSPDFQQMAFQRVRLACAQTSSARPCQPGDGLFGALMSGIGVKVRRPPADADLRGGGFEVGGPSPGGRRPGLQLAGHCYSWSAAQQLLLPLCLLCASAPITWG